MAKSYESLMGAVARSVFFRPERQRVRELLSRDARPLLLVNGHEYPLFDISMNGLSFLTADQPSEWAVGDEIELSLLLHSEELYKGPARVARTEKGPRGSRIGLGLTTGFLDLPEIRRRDDEKRLGQELSKGPETVEGLVPAPYRDVISRMTHFHSYYQRSLADHEARIRSESRGEAAVAELTQRAYEAIRGRWWDYEVRASRASIECLQSRDVLIASKQYTEAMVTPIVLASTLGRRAYTKPLGYAGDYQVMLYMYEDSFEGESAYGRVIHRCYTADHPMCRGIRTRKDLIVEWMEEEHRRIQSDLNEPTTFRVVGLGCGPAREVTDFVARNRTWPGNVIWTLIDQEEEALSVAYRESRAEIAKWGSAGHLHLLNLSFVQMLSEGIPLQTPGSQHFIYSAGLFDYLRESRAQILVKALYDLLAKDGLLLVGNLVAPNEFFWGAEFLMDWTLLYRTRQEMLSLTALLPDSAQVELTEEATGAYHFLRIRKH
jgi:hypothetical protein